MKKLIRLIIIGLISLSTFSCQTKNSKQSTESKFYTDSIYSKHLNEYRKHNVYLPKGFDSEKKYSIIYATDGSKSIEKSFLKSVMDSLIGNEIIKPTMYIGSHSNSKIADSTSTTLGNGDKVYLQFRYFEYVNQYYADSHNIELANRFKNHMQYFNVELLSSIENKFNQKLTKEDRYFYGVSNGAGFGLSLLNNHPSIIGTYLCFSTFGGDIQTNNWEVNVDYAKLYLEYGSEEPFFLKEDADFLEAKYEELNLFGKFNEFEGGHDYKKWNEKFIEIISKTLATE